MPRMIDLIRASAVPATLVQSAARGALSIPPAETLEILVYLARHNQVFGAQARMTLAGWDEKLALAAAADPKTPQEVLDYLIAPQNLRPKLLPALLENPAVPEPALVELAVKGSREVVEAMARSSRVAQTRSIRDALTSNANVIRLNEDQPDEPAAEMEVASTEISTALAEPELPAGVPQEGDPTQTERAEEGLEQEIGVYLRDHAAEIAAEEGKPFQPIGGIYEEGVAGGATPATNEAASAPPTVETPSPVALAAKKREEAELKRGSALQKISKLDVKGRIQLAMKGTKEERSILIRDGTKIVALAVLDSPKISDGEVEAFASQKNVLEAVLRGIPMKRRFAKHYPVIRNLVFNPRTPLDLSLSLMKNILVNDLRNLSGNKEVSDTVRKLAMKMFKQKSDTTKKHTD
ncbi:MAG: hypothetical protein DMG68_07655 [Acidobacteria bacterium]|nr:MAG: hypothetical protein DMG68_07655 [Acidobacteriota bacterium]